MISDTRTTKTFKIDTLSTYHLLDALHEFLASDSPLDNRCEVALDVYRELTKDLPPDYNKQTSRAILGDLLCTVVGTMLGIDIIVNEDLPDGTWRWHRASSAIGPERS